MLRRLQHEKQNRNSFCLCEITLRTMRLIQNRYTPKVPSRGQSLLRNSTSSVFQSKKRNASVQLPQHNPLQKTSVRVCAKLRETLCHKLETWNLKQKQSATPLPPLRLNKTTSFICLSSAAPLCISFNTNHIKKELGVALCKTFQVKIKNQIQLLKRIRHII